MLTLSSTAYGTASTCLKRYEYAHVLNLSPRPRDLPPRMRKGIWIHKALEARARGDDWRATLDDCRTWAVGRGVEDADADALLTECGRLVDAYIAHWAAQGELPAPGDFAAIEQSFGADLAPDFRITTTVDAVVRRRGGLWLWEYKSTEHVPSASWRAVDPQTLLQLVTCTMSGLPIDGIVFDYIVTTEPKVPRVRADGMFYAGTEDRWTTAAAFEQAIPEVTRKWKGANGDVDEYLDTMRRKCVNDAAFFERYPVYRPMDAVRETLADARALRDAILHAQQTGHWRRLSNLLMCPRFCPFTDLCASEYVLGRPSTMRESDFVANQERGY